MNQRKFICSIFFIFALISNQMEETDATVIAAIIAKVIIAAKIIKGLAIAGWFTRGGFGSGFGTAGAAGAGGTGLFGAGSIFGKRKRDTAERFDVRNEDVEQLFAVVSNIDDDLCMARIICEIQANKDKKQFGELGDGIRRIFENYDITTAHARSPVIKYKQAAILGSLSANNVCSQVYSMCRLKSDQIYRVIDTANNVDW